MAEELRNIEANVTDQQVMMRILQSLPPSYNHFLSAWESVPVADQTIANLTARLILEEIRKRENNNGENDPVDVAFFANYPGRPRQPTQIQPQYYGQNAYSAGGGYQGRRGQHNDGGYPGLRRGNRGYPGRGHYHRGAFRGNYNGPTVCYYCQVPGHKYSNCRTRRHDEERDSRSNKHNQHRSERNSFGCISSFCFMARRQSDWYADSGATRHMTDQKSFFNTFKELEDGKWTVTGIGGTRLSALGIGDIDVTSYVDGKRLNGTFKDVLYVPGIGTNLFSIGTATDAGLNVSFSCEKVAFIKDNVTIMQGRRVGESLYHIQVIISFYYYKTIYLYHLQYLGYS